MLYGINKVFTKLIFNGVAEFSLMLNKWETILHLSVNDNNGKIKGKRLWKLCSLNSFNYNIISNSCMLRNSIDHNLEVIHEVCEGIDSYRLDIDYLWNKFIENDLIALTIFCRNVNSNEYSYNIYMNDLTAIILDNI